MNRDYGKVYPRFWQAGTGKALRGDPEAQVLAMYLMTSPHANMIGVYHCPVLYMAHETGLSIEGATKALARLINDGFCTFDGDDDVVWVHEMAAHQVGTNLSPKDKQVIGLRKQVEQIAQSGIRAGFEARYREDFHLFFDRKEASPLQAPCKPLPSQEQEQEQEQEKETPPFPPRGGVVGFSKFWMAYPKKIGKGAAEKAWARAKVNGHIGEVLQALDVQKRSQMWTKDNGQYIPNPATWINQRRWEDDLRSPQQAETSPWDGAL